MSTKNYDSKNKGFGERLARLIEEGNYKKAQVARAVGVSGTTIDQYLRGREPMAGTLLALSKLFKKSMEWFLTGRDQVGSNLVEDGSFVYVPKLEVTAEGGDGFANTDERQIDHLAFRSDWIDGLRIRPEHLRSIQATGDSMEPTVREGDELLVDTSRREISVDGIYCLRLSLGELVVKRVQRMPDGQYIIVSDNEKYKPYPVTPGAGDNISVVGRVVWIGRKL